MYVKFLFLKINNLNKKSYKKHKCICFVCA